MVLCTGQPGHMRKPLVTLISPFNHKQVPIMTRYYIGTLKAACYSTLHGIARSSPTYAIASACYQFGIAIEANESKTVTS